MMMRHCWRKVVAVVATLGLGVTFLTGNAQAGWLRDRGRCRCRGDYGWAAAATSGAAASGGFTAPVPPAGGSQGFLPPAPPVAAAAAETAPDLAPSAPAAPAKASPPAH